jgi:hypothetical protein
MWAAQVSFNNSSVVRVYHSTQFITVLPLTLYILAVELTCML